MVYFIARPEVLGSSPSSSQPSRGWHGCGFLLAPRARCGYGELAPLIVWMKPWCLAITVVMFFVLGSRR